MSSRRSSAVLVLAAALAAAWGARAQVSAAELKAAFAYNFALFTQWPTGVLPEGAPLRLCAAARTPELAALRRLQGRTVAGHEIEVETMDAPSERCHVMLYVADALPPAPGVGTLTVCDGERHACGDAVITLAREGDRIRFDVDAARARALKLTLSSKLLRLARRVQ